MRLLVALVTLVSGSALAQTYTIQTYAGGALPTNIVGTLANLGPVSSVAGDSKGNIFVALADYHVVLEWNGNTGVVVPVAGNGTPGFSGDGGQGNRAQLSSPRGVAADTIGNLYIADSGNNRIRRVVLSTGAITTFAGNGTAGYGGDNGLASGAELNQPAGVALDAFSNVYIADYGNHRVRRVSGGTITTVAGNGTAGYGGDNGPATDAELNGPSGIAYDTSHNVYYIADSANNRVRMVSNGTITTLAGTGTAGYSGDFGQATGAKLNFPMGVGAVTSGDVYIADTQNNRVRLVSGGVITTVAGNGTPGYSGDNGPATSAQLQFPGGVAVDRTSRLLIADTGNERVRYVSSAVITTVVGGASPSGDGRAPSTAQLDAPSGVALDSAANLYVADTNNSRIREVSNNLMSTVAGNGVPGSSGDNGPATSAELDAPNRVTVDSSGSLYMADGDSSVRRVSSGVITTVADIHSLKQPHGMATDAAGNLYIADTNHHLVRKLSGGTLSIVAGTGFQGFNGDGNRAIDAELSQPEDVALDASGNLYIADSGNARIRKVTNGFIQTVAGGGPVLNDGLAATNAKLNNPSGIALDSEGNLYIADAADCRVRRVVGGVISTIAGTGTCGFSGDNGPAAGALINSPNSIAVDAAGNVYVADTLNNRVRLLIPSGPVCAYTVSPLSLNADAAGGHLDVTIQTGDGCAWEVSALPQWITLFGNAMGTGSTTVTLVVGANQGALRNATITIAGVPVTVTQQPGSPGLPSINAGGVVNAADSAAPVAPGSIASVYGSFLLTQSMQDTSLPLLTNLLGLSLEFGNGSAAPLFFVSGLQANIQIPWELDAASPATLTAMLGGQSSAAQSVSLATYAPGIFTTNSQGTGQGSITDATNHLVNSSNPATAGVTFLQIFCTGLGPVSDPPATGSPASLNPLSRTPTNPTVTIGGVTLPEASVTFSGLAPGYVGLYQVNAKVPAGIAASDAVPLTISIGGATSNTVTIAVK